MDVADTVAPNVTGVTCKHCGIVRSAKSGDVCKKCRKPNSLGRKKRWVGKRIGPAKKGSGSVRTVSGGLPGSGKRR